jgi:hypothetical protein
MVHVAFDPCGSQLTGPTVAVSGVPSPSKSAVTAEVGHTPVGETEGVGVTDGVSVGVGVEGAVVGLGDGEVPPPRGTGCQVAWDPNRKAGSRARPEPSGRIV